jgi:D-hexose-6-phosphate mutarotase
MILFCMSLYYENNSYLNSACIIIHIALNIYFNINTIESLEVVNFKTYESS